MLPIDSARCDAQPALEAVVVRTLTWRLVPFLFLLYIVAYLDRINLGFAALQMQQQLAFTDAVYGFGKMIPLCDNLSRPIATVRKGC